MNTQRFLPLRALFIILAISFVTLAAGEQQPSFEKTENRDWGPSIAGPSQTALLRSLWLGSLPPVPSNPTNAIADDPRAARFGYRLFFDTRLSADGKIACGSCHRPERYFSDNRPLAQGIGIGSRRTMTVVGSAYSPWFFWDGRKDSQWSQALEPLENPVEHGTTRLQVAHLIADDADYRQVYESLFGPLPDLSNPQRFPATAGPVEDATANNAWQSMAAADRLIVNRLFANIGKAIAAYERRITPRPSRFDTYVQALLQGNNQAMTQALNDTEKAGLHLFIGKAQCVRCHNGPLLTNNEFHNTGVPGNHRLSSDQGRRSGILEARADIFNCLGNYSDGNENDCAELRFAKTGQSLEGAFKTPTLRDVTQRSPYMHGGQFKTLRQVLNHYNNAPPAATGFSELVPLGLSATELDALEAFLHTLTGLRHRASWWSMPPR